MRITSEHVLAFAFWRLPPSIRRLAPKLREPDIHALINAHAGLKLDTVLHNALHLVKLRRKNGDNDKDALALSSWDLHNIPRRYFMFKRWQLRLNRARKVAV